MRPDKPGCFGSGIELLGGRLLRTPRGMTSQQIRDSIMIEIAKITLNITSEIQLYLSNGGPAGDPIEPREYVAVANTDQQPGWFSLYVSDNGDASGEKIANVYLLTSPTGEIRLGA
jgi:hypothetical protein